MFETTQNGLVAVDGGGTFCRVALKWRGQLSEVKTGSANVTTDRQAAIVTIRKALKEVSSKAGLTAQELQKCPAYLGLAGVLDEADAQSIVSQLPFELSRIEDDRPAAVVGALGDSNGIVAGIGTGTFLAKKSDAGMRLVGGWGYRLADEASGAWLGRKLLNSILQAFNGLRAATPLTNDVFAQFQNSASRIVTFSFQAKPTEFAKFAPQVVEAAKQDDPVGLEIMALGAAYLERTITALSWTPDEPICLIGGVAQHYRSYLPSGMRQSLVDPKGTALDGALQLAASLADHQIRRQP